MVFGIIAIAATAAATPIAAVALPTAATSTATSAATLAQGAGNQRQDGDSEQPDPSKDPRLAKFTVRIRCDSKSSAAHQVDGGIVVLREGKLYIDNEDPEKRQFSDGHPFSGFFLEYPIEGGPNPLALVSTISVEPPFLNWIYVDKDSLELRYGNKSQSLPHIFAPWDWTDDQQYLMLESWEGFVAMEESRGKWVLCYDIDEDHLADIRKRRRVLECDLERELLQGSNNIFA